MTTPDDPARRLWELATELRDGELSVENVTRVYQREHGPVPPAALYKFSTKLGRAGSGHGVDHVIPPWVAEFVASAAAAVSPAKPESIFDPWAGGGLLTVPVASHLSAWAVAYCYSDAAAEMLERLEGAERVTVLREAEPEEDGDLFDETKAAAPVDVVACSLPWGMRPRRGNGGGPKSFDASEDTLIAAGCRRLKPGGAGLFLVTDKFFIRHRADGQERLAEELGFGLEAAFELPAGTFSPSTAVTAHLIVLRSGASGPVFTGRATEDRDRRETLLENLKAGREDRDPSLGVAVSAEEFRGFTHFERRQQLDLQVRRQGLEWVSLASLGDLSIAGRGGDSGDRPGAVYIPEHEAGQAATAIDLPTGPRRVHRLDPDTEKVNPEYLATWLNTPAGRLWRRSHSAGTAMPMLSASLLRSADVPLPRGGLAVQNEAVACRDAIAALRREVDELETKLWAKPAAAADIRVLVKKVNHEDRFDDWVETLPFPLASVLRGTRHGGDAPNERVTRKVHFFEALGRFVGTVLLSGFTAHDPSWAVLGPKLQTALGTKNLSLSRSTFGTWKVTIDILSKAGRTMLNDEPDLAAELFRVSDRDVLQMVFAKRHPDVLGRANAIRNSAVGHVGRTPEARAIETDRQLEALIGEVRETYGVLWERYRLLAPVPGQMSYRNGRLTQPVRVVTGTRVPFAQEAVETPTPMDEEKLHLRGLDEARSLELLPLVKLKGTPAAEQNSCYFYDRVEGVAGCRFIAYHGTEDGEHTDDDPAVMRAVTSLEEEPA
ncbi:hypothetical protein [Alienimonas sp. DA493]|uniref:hypothetical protein n=1 Tax=Alienimonas sp. DA493 TaxID=3373605 RepID=UPI00375532DD